MFDLRRAGLAHVAAPDSQHAIARAWEALQGLPSQVEALHSPLCELVELTKRLIELTAKKEPITRALLLSTAPQEFRAMGYAHNRVYAGGAGTVKAEIGGVTFSVTLAAGWNSTDWPDGTILSSATVAPAYDSYVLQLTDERV